MSGRAVVLCLDFESYLTAIASMRVMEKDIGHGLEAEKVTEAISDFHRAHATFALLESQVHVPAFLRRQI